MHRRILFSFALFFCSLTARAQMERTVYQIFPADSARVIVLDIVGSYELIPWAADNVLAETHIQIWNASPEILDYLIEKGRYALDPAREGDNLTLVSKDKERKALKNRNGVWCDEVVLLKLFIPDFYQWPEGQAVQELILKEN